jgi:tRNA pseudouridine13 synthase
VFGVPVVDDELVRRCAALEIHPTAPLAGGGESLANGTELELELRVAGQFPEALAVIQSERMNAERRALRMRVRELGHDYSDGVLRLRFALDAGSFATAVLREIIASDAAGE